MALSNAPVTFSTTVVSDMSYIVAVSGVAAFSGKFIAPSYGTYEVDITEILKPYVHAEEITNLASGSGPTSAPYSVIATGGTATPSTGTLYYLNDVAETSIPAPLRPQDWGQEKVAGQFYFSYSAQGPWSGSQYGSAPDTCTYNAEIIFTDPYGMPQGIPVKAEIQAMSDWDGVVRRKNYQSPLHRTRKTDGSVTLSWTCYTPNLTRENRARLARWLGQSEYVYLYDVESGQLHPCQTPATDSGKGIFGKLTITLVSDY